MTKMTTIPENYNNIRAGIVELLKTARSAAARNVNSIYDGHLLGNWTTDRPVRASWREAGRIWRRTHQATCQRSIGQFGRGFGSRNLAQMRSILPGLAARQDFADTV